MGRNAAGRDRFRTRVEYFPAATGMEIKSGLIDEASVCQTFHLESKDKIRLRDRKISYPRPAIARSSVDSVWIFHCHQNQINIFCLSSAIGSKSILPLREHVRGSDMSETEMALRLPIIVDTHAAPESCSTGSFNQYWFHVKLIRNMMRGRPICEKSLWS